MLGRTIAFIGRAQAFSPQSVDKDAAVLSAVRSGLQTAGFDCLPVMSEDELPELKLADVYLTMGRSQRTLELLSRQEQEGRLVINTVKAVHSCNQRMMLMQQLETAGIPVPPLTGSDGYWVKRGEGCRETDADVQYAPDRATADRLCEQLHSRGIRQIDMRAHIVGDWVKFYGVRHVGFFRCYGQQENPVPALVSQRIAHLADDVAQLVGIDIYGGDCIVRADGQPVLIDFNDWPSFSRCCDEAAEVIAVCVTKKWNNGEWSSDK